MEIKNFLENISKDTIFSYIVISICILFFFTNIVDIELGHIISLIIILIVLLYLTVQNNENIEDFNKEIEFKLKSLLIDGSTPSHFYTDVDLIILFFSVKQDMSEYNYDSYKNAVECANNVLRIKYDIERDLCDAPFVPDIQKNFSPMLHKDKDISDNYEEEKRDFLNIDQYDLVDDKKCKGILVNAYENYQVAEEYLKKCMNYLHSLIIVTPSDPVTDRKHEIVLERVHILLKRNLDDIKTRYYNSLKRGISHNTKFIDDYDNVKAFNKHSETNFINNSRSNGAVHNFNFY